MAKIANLDEFLVAKGLTATVQTQALGRSGNAGGKAQGTGHIHIRIPP